MNGSSSPLEPSALGSNNQTLEDTNPTRLMSGSSTFEGMQRDSPLVTYKSIDVNCTGTVNEISSFTRVIVGTEQPMAMSYLMFTE